MGSVIRSSGWRRRAAALPALALLVLLVPPAHERAAAEDAVTRTSWKRPAQAKPLSRTVKHGLRWILRHQARNGSWTQGVEARVMRQGTTTPGIGGVPSLGDTGMAALALVRSGSTPAGGDHARPVLRAVQYVCSEVEEAPETGLTVARTRSRIQSKLGTHIDTFFTTMLLAEVKGTMGSRAGEAMLDEAMAKVVAKIAKGQRADGTFGGQGWAQALSQAMASKGINRYVQAGGHVDEEVLARLEKAALDRYDTTSRTFSTAGSAGVGLYAAAANLAAMQDAANTNAAREKAIIHMIRIAPTETERRENRQLLERFRRNAAELDSALRTVVRRLDNRNFVKGFGSNGGEEFLSYMAISESLAVKRGPAWRKWDRKITAALERIQNGDGSWTGHHCITGRTFCTASALLVLTADRAPVPVTVSER